MCSVIYLISQTTPKPRRNQFRTGMKSVSNQSETWQEPISCSVSDQSQTNYRSYRNQIEICSKLELFEFGQWISPKMRDIEGRNKQFQEIGIFFENAYVGHKLGSFYDDTAIVFAKKK